MVLVLRGHLDLHECVLSQLLLHGLLKFGGRVVGVVVEVLEAAYEVILPEVGRQSRIHLDELRS